MESKPSSLTRPLACSQVTRIEGHTEIAYFKIPLQSKKTNRKSKEETLVVLSPDLDASIPDASLAAYTLAHPSRQSHHDGAKDVREVKQSVERLERREGREKLGLGR